MLVATRPLPAAVIKKLSYKYPFTSDSIHFDLSAQSWCQFSQKLQELIIMEILSPPNKVEIGQQMQKVSGRDCQTDWLPKPP